MSSVTNYQTDATELMIAKHKQRKLEEAESKQKSKEYYNEKQNKST